jgi:hypothetical protein
VSWRNIGDVSATPSGLKREYVLKLGRGPGSRREVPGWVVACQLRGGVDGARGPAGAARRS